MSLNTVICVERENIETFLFYLRQGDYETARVFYPREIRERAGFNCEARRVFLTKTPEEKIKMCEAFAKYYWKNWLR